MSHYLDASLVVAVLTNEESRVRVRAWLASQPPGSLVISDWVSAEVASGLSTKVRTGAITITQRARVAATYSRLVVGLLTIVPIFASHFADTARFSARHELVLRAADALHLAIASERGDTLATLDVRQAEAGQRLGIATLLV